MKGFDELRSMLDKLEERHVLLLEEGERLIAEAERVAYCDTRLSLMLVMRWRTCSNPKCIWCPSGHGPYWRYSRYLGKTQKTISREMKGITHREMLRVMGHTMGYKELKPLDDRRKSLIKRMKAVKDATVKIRRAIKSALKDDSIW